MSLRSSSQQPPCICQMRSAPAANRTRHVGSVTCARYRSVVSLSAVEIDPPLVTRFDVIPQVKSHLHFVCLNFLLMLYEMIWFTTITIEKQRLALTLKRSKRQSTTQNRNTLSDMSTCLGIRSPVEGRDR